MTVRMTVWIEVIDASFTSNILIALGYTKIFIKL